MRQGLRAVGAALAALVLMAGCRTLAGSGHVVERTREVGAFHGVAVGHGLSMVVREGPYAPLKLRGDDNLLEQLVVEVKDGVLHVGLPDRTEVRPTGRIEIEVSAPATLDTLAASGGAELTSGPQRAEHLRVQASGGAHVQCGPLEAARLELQASGGSVLTVQGKAQDADVQLSGGSRLDGERLALARLAVEASGGAHARTRVSESLDGQLSGGSVLQVSGRPRVERMAASGGATTEYAD